MVLHVTKCTVFKAAIMSTEGNDLIVDSGSAVYGRDLCIGFNPTVSIRIPGWCGVDCPVQLDVEVNIFA